MVVAYLYTGEEQNAAHTFDDVFLQRPIFPTMCAQSIEISFLRSKTTRFFSWNDQAEWIRVWELEQETRHMVAIQEHLDWNIGGKRNLLMQVADCTWTAGFCLQTWIWRSANRFSNLVWILFWTAARGSCTSFSGDWRNGTTPWDLVDDAAWQSGCDEDFLGSYGQTDPHFD